MNKIFVTFIFFFLVSCGFKVVDRSKLSNFEIAEISTSGDKRVGYVIKNKLLLYSKSSERKLIKIYLDTEKKKIIKEKNIKNEITKYQISLKTTLKFNRVGDADSYQFSKTKTGDYNVQTKMSDTINNEKQLITLLTESLAEEIIDELISSLNAI